MADEVLRQGVQGIADMITIPGLINVDFADVKSIMKDAGTALMGIGIGTGEERATVAAQSVSGARGVLFNICGGEDMTISEVNEAAEVIFNAADKEDANIIFGAVIDPRMDGEVRITVLATGFDSADYNQRHQRLTPEPERQPEKDIPAFLRRR